MEDVLNEYCAKCTDLGSEDNNLDYGWEDHSNCSVLLPKVTDDTLFGRIHVTVHDDEDKVCKEFGLLNINAQEETEERSKFSPMSCEEFNQMSQAGLNWMSQLKPSMGDGSTFYIQVAHASNFEEAVEVS